MSLGSRSGSPVGRRRRVAASVALVLFTGAVGVVVQALGRHTGPLILGLVGLAVATSGLWWVLTDVGIRWAVGVLETGVGVVAMAVALWLVVARSESFVLRVVLLAALVAGTLLLGRYSLMRPVRDRPSIMTPRGRHGPSHPVLLCNPWSGGGKVERFGLVDLAHDLGIDVVLLDHGLDLEQLTRDAVARGADCLGMAGGDGSQALVASVAVEHDLPFVCIPAGTRNHFALDLGLDRDDPRSAMSAFRDGVERRIDFATFDSRLFLNNVSLGVYGTIVQSDDYRDAKIDVSRSMLRELLGRQSEPFDLQYTTPDGIEVDGAFVILVSNNPYVLGPSLDISQRRRLDGGKLGVLAVSTRTGAQAARLATLTALGLRKLSGDWHEFTAREFDVRSRSGTVLMGVDGEACEARTPLRFAIHPLGLRMLVPRGNLEEAERRRVRDLRLIDVITVAAGREPESES